MNGKFMIIILSLAIVSISFTGLTSSNQQEPAQLINQKDFLFYRINVSNGKVPRIVPHGTILSKQPYSSGIYTATFAVDESHKKFKYHQQYLILGFAPKINTKNELSSSFRKGSEAEYYIIWWRKGGALYFYRKTKTKTEKLGVWIKPGPDKNTAYKKDEFVTLHAVVSNSEKSLKLYLNRKVSGEPDCEFKLHGPINGQYGFHNNKDSSYVFVKDLTFSHLPAK